MAGIVMILMSLIGIFLLALWAVARLLFLLAVPLILLLILFGFIKLVWRPVVFLMVLVLLVTLCNHL